MPIDSLEDVRIPAIPERVYNKWIVDSMSIVTDRNTGRQSVTVRFALCREVRTGIFEYSPNGETREASDPDIYALIPQFPIIGEAISRIAEAAYTLGRAREVI